MTKIPLTEYLSQPGKSQQKLALAVGVTQGAISKMIRTKRDVEVIEHDDGSIELVEQRVIGSTSTAA